MARRYCWDDEHFRVEYHVDRKQVERATSPAALAALLTDALDDLLDAYKGDAGGDWDEVTRQTVPVFSDIVEAARYRLANGDWQG